MKDYTTGRAARELRVSQSCLRVLCQAGMIAARATGGGHWRIPRSEVDRLRREGVPEPPPATAAESQAQPANTPAGNPHRHPVLLAEPSKDAVAAADEVVRLENEVKGVGLKRAKEEGLDWFRQREQSQATLKAAQRQRAAEAEAQQERRQWADGWLGYAVRTVPEDAGREVELDVHQAVEEALGKLSPEQPQSLVQRLVLAAVEKALAPWWRRTGIEKAIQSARKELPVVARTLAPEYFEPTAWEVSAMKAATDAIRQLGNDAPLNVIRAVAAQAGKRVAREYEHRQACERIISGIWMLYGTAADDQAAREAVKVALEKLPIGSTQAEMVKVRDATLAPFKAAAERTRAAAQAASDADRYLAHVQTYVEQLDALEHGPGHSDGYSERRRFGDQIAKEIRPALIERLGQGPMDWREADRLIEEMVDAKLDGE